MKVGDIVIIRPDSHCTSGACTICNAVRIIKSTEENDSKFAVFVNGSTAYEYAENLAPAPTALVALYGKETETLV
jgi:hypothetical protein